MIFLHFEGDKVFFTGKCKVPQLQRSTKKKKIKLQNIVNIIVKLNFPPPIPGTDRNKC